MSRKAIVVLAAFLGGVFAAASPASDDLTRYLGTPAAGRSARVVKIDEATELIRVGHLETLTIENRKGQAFAWRFNTPYVPTGFPLKSIAPPDFEAGATWVYVSPKRRPD